ncbi:MAG: hypothetical protein JF614_20885 [Acidobacteria bacterium]|jgi:hypothetical protein|nr:hypothetical protein [Acidobacteriota bacterium]
MSLEEMDLRRGIFRGSGGGVAASARQSELTRSTLTTYPLVMKVETPVILSEDLVEALERRMRRQSAGLTL